MASNGLGTSMWAARNVYGRNRYNNRSQSLPQEPEAAQPSTTPTSAITTTTTTSQPTITTPASLTPALAFHRFEQACQRLRWKYIDLEASYKRALAPEEWLFSVHDAERNFKVDFHEFYVWIEQTLVLALLVFGVVVPRGQQTNGDSAYRDGPRGPRSFAAHTYHHNVLKALDEENNPLHEALGKGDMYDLTWIVTTILSGLELTYGMAAARVEEVKISGIDTDSGMENAEGVDEWEWMAEMDWEA
ncbi:hypothetical protein PT974_04438 [Cladobotryum mycophilum]|uniref:Uncharacterized protein n=1 Tax=Cladobotryum mycophilum TaxID=491253 RepID=A0ABR0SW88_9HYPO